MIDATVRFRALHVAAKSVRMRKGMTEVMKKVLIVVDMQNDFVDGALGTREAEGIVGNAVSKIEAFEGSIIATLDTHGDDYLETAEGKKLPVPHCIKMTRGWLVNEAVRGALAGKDCAWIEKNTFGSKKLVKAVRKIKKKSEIEIELIGLCTDICVVSNALLLKAFFPEAKISVAADCCAGVTPETHKAALETMKMCQIEVTGEMN